MYTAVLFDVSCTQLYFLVYHLHSCIVWFIMYTAVLFGVSCTQLYCSVFHAMNAMNPYLNVNKQTKQYTLLWQYIQYFAELD